MVLVYSWSVDERLKKLKKIKEEGINPYPYRFDRTHSFVDIKNKYPALSDLDQEVRTCGRITAIRGHGKTLFATLHDEHDTLQIYIRKDEIGDVFERFHLYDIGDLIGVTGKVFKTKTGEITVLVKEFMMLAKALRPLPEKWHGLKDVEIRYRKRYLDLLANSQVREIFRKRASLVAHLRDFFDKHGFIEMETPILQPIYGGGVANPFKTYYHALEQDMYLRIADELYLKRLLVGGYEKVYEVCRDFRNEGIDRYHNPEFTMVEAYQAYVDYTDIMTLVEDLLVHLVNNLRGDGKLVFGENEVIVDPPFKRVRYPEALSAKLGFDVLTAHESQLSKACDECGIDHRTLTIGSKIDKLFGALVQKEVTGPAFITDFPKIISPLAKVHRDDERLVERFELILFGIEVANAFSELNDPVEQRARFEEQLARKEEGISEVDEDFLEALEYGMPPTGGLGVGIDRLCMIIFNLPSLRDVILFPQLKKIQNA